MVDFLLSQNFNNNYINNSQNLYALASNNENNDDVSSNSRKRGYSEKAKTISILTSARTVYYEFINPYDNEKNAKIKLKYLKENSDETIKQLKTIKSKLTDSKDIHYVDQLISNIEGKKHQFNLPNNYDPSDDSTNNWYKTPFGIKQRIEVMRYEAPFDKIRKEMKEGKTVSISELIEIKAKIRTNNDGKGYVVEFYWDEQNPIADYKKQYNEEIIKEKGKKSLVRIMLTKEEMELFDDIFDFEINNQLNKRINNLKKAKTIDDALNILEEIKKEQEIAKKNFGENSWHTDNPDPEQKYGMSVDFVYAAKYYLGQRFDKDIDNHIVKANEYREMPDNSDEDTRLKEYRELKKAKDLIIKAKKNEIPLSKDYSDIDKRISALENFVKRNSDFDNDVRLLIKPTTADNIEEQEQALDRIKKNKAYWDLYKDQGGKDIREKLGKFDKFVNDKQGQIEKIRGDKETKDKEKKAIIDDLKTVADLPEYIKVLKRAKKYKDKYGKDDEIEDAIKDAYKRILKDDDCNEVECLRKGLDEIKKNKNDIDPENIEEIEKKYAKKLVLLLLNDCGDRECFKNIISSPEYQLVKDDKDIKEKTLEKGKKIVDSLKDNPKELKEFKNDLEKLKKDKKIDSDTADAIINYISGVEFEYSKQSVLQKLDDCSDPECFKSIVNSDEYQLVKNDTEVKDKTFETGKKIVNNIKDDTILDAFKDIIIKLKDTDKIDKKTADNILALIKIKKDEDKTEALLNIIPDYDFELKSDKYLIILSGNPSEDNKRKAIAFFKSWGINETDPRKLSELIKNKKNDLKNNPVYKLCAKYRNSKLKSPEDDWFNFNAITSTDPDTDYENMKLFYEQINSIDEDDVPNGEQAIADFQIFYAIALSKSIDKEKDLTMKVLKSYYIVKTGNDFIKNKGFQNNPYSKNHYESFSAAYSTQKRQIKIHFTAFANGIKENPSNTEYLAKICKKSALLKKAISESINNSYMDDDASYVLSSTIGKTQKAHLVIYTLFKLKNPDNRKVFLESVLSDDPEIFEDYYSVSKTLKTSVEANDYEGIYNALKEKMNNFPTLSLLNDNIINVITSTKREEEILDYSLEKLGITVD